MEQTRHQLEPEQLEQLTKRMRADVADGIVGTFEILEPRWDELERVDPRRYAIPAAQWLELAQAATDAGAGLTWMNVGPASYEPEPDALEPRRRWRSPLAMPDAPAELEPAEVTA